MAKWGEGDPRWVVEERSDATNVHNWHWTERDATASSKVTLKELLVGLTIQDDKGDCTISEISSITGEASANNRKGKLIFFYEWDILLAWSGHLRGCTTKLEGTASIPNISDENSLDEIDIIVSTKTNTEESRHLKDIMIKKGIPLIRDQIGKYIALLKKDMSKGMILPSDEAVENKPDVANLSKPKGLSPKVTQKEKHVNKENLKNSLQSVMTLKLSKEFKCSADDLYETLTDLQRVSIFTRSQASMDVRAGGKFALFDSNISGEFISLDPRKIVQRWRFKDWPDAHYSTVTIDLTQKPDCTNLTLTQVGIPSNEYDRTKQGWNMYYWQPIMTTFGYGAQLF